MVQQRLTGKPPWSRQKRVGSLAESGLGRRCAVTVWIVQYVYLDADGDTAVSTSRLHAPNRESAMKAAAGKAPAEEFTLTLQAETDDQHLGTVRHRALELSGQGVVISEREIEMFVEEPVGEDDGKEKPGIEEEEDS